MTKQQTPPNELLEFIVETTNEQKPETTQTTQPAELKKLMFSDATLWFWLTITVSIVTAAAVFGIPQDVYPLVYLREILGAVFVSFLPGLVFLKTLYPSKPPITTSSENLDTIERITLSFGLSITLVATIGLVRNYTPWGIRLTPITLSLLAFTLIFGVVAVLREFQASSHQISKPSR